MATRSRIGIMFLDGTIKSIYCHWDGYPANNGKLLIENWADSDKIKQLMGLGNISYLGKEIGHKQKFDQPTDRNWCLAYGRDRNEADNEAVWHKDLAEFLSDREEFNYVFKDGYWICFDYDKNEVNLEMEANGSYT